MNRLVAFLVTLLLAPPFLAPPLLAQDTHWLGWPIDCILGESCFLMNYVDADPGAGAEDFTCGPLSYDGHKGTDIALPTHAEMRAGVAVLAAAPGVVRGTRDGMPDLGLDGTPAELLAGKDCGNGVLIDHGGGWQTQYCHLRQGSVAVAQGETVAAGDRLGLVGFSGRTQYPHVHISVRKDGQDIDPFDSDGARTCGADDGPGDDLWADPPAYDAGSIVATGFQDAVPDYDAVKDGTAGRARFPADAPALVGWALIHGGRPGDRVEITLTAPDGSVFSRTEDGLTKAQALLMRASGRKRPGDGWASGDWHLGVRLLRAGAVLDEAGGTARIGG